MNAATRKILDDLKAGGLDVTSLEQQANVNVIADKKLDEIMGGGLLRQSEYTRVMNELNRSKSNPNDLQVKVNKLASLHDFVTTLEANDPLYQSTLERIVEAEDDLISLGHDPTEVKAVSVDAGKGISIKKDVIIDKKVEDKVVNNGVTAEEFQKGLATIGLGSVAVGIKASKLLRDAEKLGIEVTPEMEEKLLEGIQTRFGKGQATLEQVADDVLGLAKKRNELNTAKIAEDIEKAREEGKAAGRSETEKEYGGAPRRQVGRKESSVYSRQDRIIIPTSVEGLKKADDGRIEVPMTQDGKHPQLFRLHRQAGENRERISRATSLINDEEAMNKLGAVAD